jgi:hypothetical protein
MEEILNIPIPKEIKTRLEEHKDFDWKNYLIEVIERRLKEFEVQNLLSDIDRLNERLETSEIPSWRIIREERDARS